MITFQNKMPYPIKLVIGDNTIVIDEYGEHNYDTSVDVLDFVVGCEQEKTKILGYLLLAAVGLIGVILDIGDSMFLDFKKALSLPVEVNVKNVKNNVLVYFEEPRKGNIGFCTVNANTDFEANPLINEKEIKQQYKSYQKECVAVFSVVLIFLVALCVFALMSKSIEAYVTVGAVLLAVLGVWLYLHKKNINAVSDIIKTKQHYKS